MSKSTNARRRGLAAVATTALVAGACFAGAGVASAAPSSPAPAPKVTQGMTDQAAGDVKDSFANAFTTNTTLSFQVEPGGAANNCDTTADINKAIGFSSTPDVKVTTADTNNNGQAATIPTYTVKVDSADPNCATVGIKDLVTVTFTQPSSGDAGDQLTVTVGGVKYNVGTDAPTGDVHVVATGSGLIAATASGDVVNAVVVNRSFTFIPKLSAEPNTNGNGLGTATFDESTAGAYFPKSTTTEVDLVLSGAGKFTNGVVPTITVPSGYTVTTDAAGNNPGTPAANGSNTYTFYVKAPATLPAGGATVTVAGLKADVGGVETITVTPTTTPAGGTAQTGDAMDALNVVTQTRVGGDDRYATAARLFNSGGFSGDAVLSGGEKFPDALSANYLASKLGTGTLLTRTSFLSQDARQSLLNNNIDTVYITGGYAAVSKAVEDEVTSLHVGNNSSAPNIQVVRLGGSDRYATNKKINTSQLANSNTAILAAGTAPYDSLAVGPVVYANGLPLILTDGSDLKHGEETQLQNINAKNVVIVGGESVVTSAVADQLKKDGYNVVRLAGATRYATAAAIATWGTEGYDFNGDTDKSDAAETPATKLISATTHLTNGLGFADALSAGPVAGKGLAPVLLAKNATEVGEDLKDYLATKTVGTAPTGTHIGTLNALGLTAAISNGLLDDAAAAIG